jgi:hypothetical protein
VGWRTALTSPHNTCVQVSVILLQPSTASIKIFCILSEYFRFLVWFILPLHLNPVARRFRPVVILNAKHFRFNCPKCTFDCLKAQIFWIRLRTSQSTHHPPHLQKTGTYWKPSRWKLAPTDNCLPMKTRE